MEELLIEYVKNYDFLFNFKNINYRDIKMRQEAWEEIGVAVNKNWQECRDSWTKLRNAYTNALKRRRTTSGQAAKKILKWKFEDQMSFLSPYLEPRASQSNFPSQNEYNVDSETNYSYIVEMQTKEDGDEVIESDISYLLPEVSTNQSVLDTPNVRSFSRPSSGKKKIEKSMSELVDIMKSNNSMRSQIRPSQPAVETTSNENDLLFLSLAKIVNKLPYHEQVRVRMSITNLVYEAELRNMPPVEQAQVEGAPGA